MDLDSLKYDLIDISIDTCVVVDSYSYIYGGRTRYRLFLASTTLLLYRLMVHVASISQGKYSPLNFLYSGPSTKLKDIDRGASYPVKTVAPHLRSANCALKI